MHELAHCTLQVGESVRPCTWPVCAPEPVRRGRRSVWRVEPSDYNWLPLEPQRRAPLGIAVLSGGGWLLLVDYRLKRYTSVPCCHTAQKSSVTLMRFPFECWKEKSLLIRLVVIELPNRRSLSLRRGRHKCN